MRLTRFLLPMTVVLLLMASIVAPVAAAEFASLGADDPNDQGNLVVSFDMIRLPQQSMPAVTEAGTSPMTARRKR